MTYVHDKKTMSKKPDLDKGFGITKEDKKRTIATDYVIDTNRRNVGEGKVNKGEPRMKD